MYKITYKAYGGYDGYYSYIAEKYASNIQELRDILNELYDEEDVEVFNI